MKASGHLCMHLTTLDHDTDYLQLYVWLCVCVHCTKVQHSTFRYAFLLTKHNSPQIPTPAPPRSTLNSPLAVPAQKGIEKQLITSRDLPRCAPERNHGSLRSAGGQNVPPQYHQGLVVWRDATGEAALERIMKEISRIFAHGVPQWWRSSWMWV